MLTLELVDNYAFEELRIAVDVSLDEDPDELVIDLTGSNERHSMDEITELAAILVGRVERVTVRVSDVIRYGLARALEGLCDGQNIKVMIAYEDPQTA